jgi:hypothetical protein
MSPMHPKRQRDTSWSITESVARRVGLFVCGLGGHELVRSYEAGRISLKCMCCSYETPGWTVKRAPSASSR